MKNVNLGKYNLKQLLRNPMTIHKIQDNLMTITGEDFLSEVIRTGAKKDIKECIKMIVDYYYDNPEVIKITVGKDTLELIEEYTGVIFGDDIKNLNI